MLESRFFETINRARAQTVKHIVIFIRPQISVRAYMRSAVEHLENVSVSEEMIEINHNTWRILN